MISICKRRSSLRDEAGATPKTATGTGALLGKVPAGRPMAVWGGRTGQRAFEYPTPMNPKEFEDAKLLWKMFYAGQCFMHVQAAAEYVLQKNIEGNNPVYYPLVTAIYTLYGKPFLKSYGVGSLSDEIIPHECLELHSTMMDHRNQTYAHSQASAFEFLDAGKVNQVRLLVHPPEPPSLICGQFQAEPPRMPAIISLCRYLQEKTRILKIELFQRYKQYIPAKEGEYVLNATDPEGDFFKPAIAVKPVIQ